MDEEARANPLSATVYWRSMTTARTRALSLAVMAAALVFLAIVSADEKETITWGATDPAWSPDGRHLAFSLFGSIWRVAATGGEAQQITTSPGYHSHPAWSPKGDKIAFVAGNPPQTRYRLRLLGVAGRLAVADLASGREQLIETPYAAGGTPSWSPDGTSIVCGLQTPDAGSLLHEVQFPDGQVTQIQFRPQRSPAGSWIDTAWSPTRKEIFFGARRGGEPQIWSIPSNQQRTMIQLPLSSYKPTSIVFFNGLSALQDGSGVVYSANEVNGKGNYDLYRIPAQGGLPVRITDTIRDEFDPAVSPDGRLIALVSNHLGNTDLFTMPINGGEKKHLPITGLRFQGPSGRVRVKVFDELGRTTRARLYVRAADGKAYYPPGEQVFFYRLDPGGTREGFFLATGDDTFSVPAGGLSLVALKGIEYRITERSIEITAGNTTEVSITMERWTNWRQRGWYTGENHFHANYNGSYFQKPKQSLAWLQAEDLNVANMVVANDAGAFVHDKEFFSGAPDPVSTDRHILYWGQEYRNSDPLGHMCFLNIQKLVSPSYTSVIGSDSPYDFPLNTMAATEARNQGGLVSYTHALDGPMKDVFDSNLGAKETPVAAALGVLDAFDILPSGEASYHLWYRLLNAGFKISPGAGNDAFTNWRAINHIPGGSRQYVKVGPVMTWDRWIARYREGKAFVTNGPLIEFDVNGQEMGSVIRIASGQAYRAKLTAQITSRVPLERVEFIRNASVIETREVDPSAQSVRFEKDVEVNGSSWFAVRVTGRPSRGVPDDGLPGYPDDGVPRAHSGVVYVTVDGKDTLIREDIAMLLRWTDRLWLYLEERNNFGTSNNRDLAKKTIDKAREHYQRKLVLAQ